MRSWPSGSRSSSSRRNSAESVEPPGQVEPPGSPLDPAHQAFLEQQRQGQEFLEQIKASQSPRTVIEGRWGF
jgi:hypothetical protein